MVSDSSDFSDDEKSQKPSTMDSRFSKQPTAKT